VSVRDLTPGVARGTRSPLSMHGEGHPESRAHRGVRSARPGFRSARPASRPGFTLVELMVSLGLAGIVAVGLYSISVIASQTFQQQHRLSELQLRLRVASEMLRGDIARAGYMSTPSSANDPRVCLRPSTPLQAVTLVRPTTNPTYNAGANTNINPVQLTLAGNYLNTDEYVVMGVRGATVFLQQRTPAFNRVADGPAFDRLFAGRMVRLIGTDGGIQFGLVASTSYAAPTSSVYPSLRLTTDVRVIGDAAGSGTAGCGLPGLGVGARIAPVTLVQYEIANVAGTQANAYTGNAQSVTGKTDLVRRELNAGAGGAVAIDGTERIVAEYAVDFDAAAVIAGPDLATNGDPIVHQLAWGDGDNFRFLGPAGSSGAVPHRVRALLVRLSVREQAQDSNFGWSPRAAATEPLTRFQIFSAQSGAARVRTAIMEVALPNVAVRNLY
jgi:prepilin-type N-terminal cleavage/methylation domain-containing protein